MTGLRARLRFLPAARDDLRQIRAYIARDNPVRARTFVEEVREHWQRLAAHPLIHAIDTRIDPRARKAVRGAYLILYEAEDEGILILRILHGARDLSNLPLRSD